MVCLTSLMNITTLCLSFKNIKSLNEFTNSWNNHPIRTAKHKSPLQLFTAGLLLLQNSQLDAMDFFEC